MYPNLFTSFRYELQLFMLLWEDNVKWVPENKSSQEALLKMHAQLMYSIGGAVRGMTLSLEVAAGYVSHSSLTSRYAKTQNQ